MTQIAKATWVACKAADTADELVELLPIVSASRLFYNATRNRVEQQTFEGDWLTVSNPSVLSVGTPVGRATELQAPPASPEEPPPKKGKAAKDTP